MDSCLRRNDGEVQGGRREARTTEGRKEDAGEAQE